MKLKKIFSVFVIALLSCVFLLSGCTKADSATSKICYDKYMNLARTYGRDVNNNVDIYTIAKKESVETWNAEYEFSVDLSSTSTKKKSITIDNGVSTSNISVSSYSDSSLSNAIDAGTLNFGLLQDTKEYQTLTSGAMAIYQIYSKNILTTDWSSLTIKPAQKDLTSLYLAIESLESSCSKLSTLKTNLQIVCKNVALDNYNTESVTYNYKKYLEGYSNFIGDTISASEAFEKVLTSVSTTSTETILPGAVKRLVATSVLYLTDFYYQKHFELNKDNTASFAPTDSTKDKYQLMLNGISSVGDYDATAIISKNYAFQMALTKLASIKSDMSNYKYAVEQINKYRTDNNSANVPTTSDKYHYVEFANDFNTKITSFQNYIYDNFVNA